MRNPIIRGTLIALAVVLVVGIIGAVIFVQPIPATDAARAALSSTATLKVTDAGDQITFIPTGTPKAGFIFYPGAKVDPVAYTEFIKAIAQAGFAVFVVRFPLNFAIISPSRADGVIDANPSIARWAIGGHSLGGATACLYAKNSGKVRALIFWAAYCDKSFDLSTRTDVQVTSISGSLDGLATPAKVESTKVYAPASTKYVVIDGGDHAQFGDYGPQSGDNPATISPQAAREQIVTATIAALEAMAK